MENHQRKCRFSMTIPSKIIWLWIYFIVLNFCCLFDSVCYLLTMKWKSKRVHTSNHGIRLIHMHKLWQPWNWNTIPFFFLLLHLVCPLHFVRVLFSSWIKNIFVWMTCDNGVDSIVIVIVYSTFTVVICFFFLLIQ